MVHSFIEIGKSLLLVVTFCVLSFLANGVHAEDVPYSVQSWPKEFGHHRVRIYVDQPCDAVWAHIPWRRHDSEPEKKAVIITDAATGERVRNVVSIDINREFGDVVFQPATGPGFYEVYYMPYRPQDGKSWNDRHYPLVYTTPEDTADPKWIETHGFSQEPLVQGKWKSLPQAEVREFQAASAFDRFDPMEVIATAEETRRLLAKHPEKTYLVFPEDRRYPVRMKNDLPHRWVQCGPAGPFLGEAQRGEFYAFQIGVFAGRKPIQNLTVSYSGLASGAGQRIPAAAFRCISLGGTDWLGQPMTKVFEVGQGKVRPLWFGVQIPPDAVAGRYEGTVTVQPQHAEATQVKLVLRVTKELLEDAGDSEPWRHSRLRWLDSTLGIDDDIVAPYTPLEVDGQTVACLGRDVRFNDLGLPESIRSNKREVLASPIRFVVETADGIISWTRGKAEIVKRAPGTVIWESTSSGGSFALHTQARMECDGYIGYCATLKSKVPADLSDIRLEIPVRREVSKYLMGMGHKGGYRSKNWEWKWKKQHWRDSVWIGDFDAGLRCRVKPFEIWYNQERGGCTITEEGPDRVVIRAYTGARQVKAGEEVDFGFTLMPTPVKPLDPRHWRQRYFHAHSKPVAPEDAVKAGATVINVHQSGAMNPYINYPFLRVKEMAEYVQKVHDAGLMVKIYYTVRELSNHAVELWALRSLGGEVFLGGRSTGRAWLMDHLGTDYARAWYEPDLPGGETDEAIRMVGLSRWHNYYIEGLGWLLKNVKIDGLYLDGIGYDREIMKRVRKVIEQVRPGSLIDVHQGKNLRPPKSGWISAANLYVEHFPYIDSLWFGEGYDYENEPPDYWLVEISGIPFGLFGEMLQGGGNPWRGMVYGMTCRLGWWGDPKPIWDLWDDFGIAEAEMLGYWNPDCPVRTDHPDILATAYRKKDKTLISLASWADDTVQCRLAIDYKAVGMDSERATLRAPAVHRFQPAASFDPSDPITVEPKRGWLLILSDKSLAPPGSADR